MRRKLLVTTIVCASATVWAQPNLDSWIKNLDQSQKAVFETSTDVFQVQTDPANVTDVCYTADSIWIKSSGLPDTAGVWTNPGSPTNQNWVFRMPRNPQEQTGTVTDVPTIFGNGVLINGVPIYGNGDGTSWDNMLGDNSGMGQGIWNGEAWYGEAESLDDRYAAHPQADGQYHTHATPFKLYENVDTNMHSPIIGWSFDGYPIYGPFGYSDSMNSSSSVIRMVSGFEIRSTMTKRDTLPDGTPLPPPQRGPDVDTTHPLGEYIEDYMYTDNGHLDEHNGRWCVTPEFPGGTYAYFITTLPNGDAFYPYYLGESYYGVVDEDNFDPMTSISVPVSATCMTVTGTVDNLFKSIEIYPNPAASYAKVTFDGSPEVVKVYDASGAEAYSGIGEGEVSIDVSSWTPGIYIIMLDYHNAKATKKLIVK